MSSTVYLFNQKPRDTKHHTMVQKCSLQKLLSTPEWEPPSQEKDPFKVSLGDTREGQREMAGPIVLPPFGGVGDGTQGLK